MRDWKYSWRVTVVGMSGSGTRKHASSRSQYSFQSGEPGFLTGYPYLSTPMLATFAFLLVGVEMFSWGWCSLVCSLTVVFCKLFDLHLASKWPCHEDWKVIWSWSCTLMNVGTVLPSCAGRLPVLLAFPAGDVDFRVWMRFCLGVGVDEGSNSWRYVLHVPLTACSFCAKP